MVTIEQVEKLCTHANVSYAEAREALEAANGDMLEALIQLERQGKANRPNGGEYVSTPAQDASNNGGQTKRQESYQQGATFSELAGKFTRFCGRIIGKGNANAFIVTDKNGEQIMKLPVTAFALLLIFLFPFTLMLLIVGLFCGVRYSFHGPDLGLNIVNDAMSNVADAADHLKNEVAQNVKAEIHKEK